MDYLNKIKSNFLQDRIKETSWRKRNYISDLYKLERIIVSGGSNSWAGSLRCVIQTENGQPLSTIT